MIRQYLARRELDRALDRKLKARKIARKVHSADTKSGMKREGSRWTPVHVALYETFCG